MTPRTPSRCSRVWKRDACVHPLPVVWRAGRAQGTRDVRHRRGLARIERARTRRAFARLFEHADLPLTPATAVAPPRIDDVQPGSPGADALREAVLPYTTPQGLAGLPACAQRVGTDALGLPTAVQLTGAEGTDAAVLSAAAAFAGATENPHSSVTIPPMTA